MLKGIDVSENNGCVDWNAVKSAGMNFAIIRLGFGNRHLDTNFYENVNGALVAGLKIGVYYYSYALDEAAARSEARYNMLSVLKDAGLTKDKLEMGLWFDMEDADGYKSGNGMPTNQSITNMCSAFIVACNEAGYSCGIYANLDWLENKIYTDQLANYVPYWVEQWGRRCDWPNATMWQFTDSYDINGKLFDDNYLL